VVIDMHATGLLPAERLNDLILLLRQQGYLVIGPVREGDCIVYDAIECAADLPRGWVDHQDKGHYRLEHTASPAYFGHTVAANAWKKFLNPPRRLLWRASRTDGGIRFETETDEAPALAFLGVRSCDLHAIAIQDRVFAAGEHRDEWYCGRSDRLFTVAVNCTRATATCFCASMGTGPGVELPTDLCLTELVDEGSHEFLVSAGSEAGRKLLAGLDPGRPDDAQRDRGRDGIAAAARQIVEGPRYFHSGDLQPLLYRNYESPAWEAVAERCLFCANCTLACPTCFCSAVEDSTDLGGDHAERWQRWDSCFNGAFSYISGGSIRHSTRLRYRQWLTHKLATWIDQFDQSGCVGCGRCISWCPVGIDLTEQILAIREAEVL
jgi:ferredoxin